MMDQWNMEWNNTNHAHYGITSEAWNEIRQIMPCKDEPVKQDVKQYKPYPVMMNQWGMKWNNTNHAQ